MKKFLIALLLISMIFVATSCNGSSGKSVSPLSAAEVVDETATESSDVAVGSEGISITLPKDFSVVSEQDLSDNPDITTAFSNESDTIAIYVVKELKSEVDENDEYSAYDYLATQFSSNLPAGAVRDNVAYSSEFKPIPSEDNGMYYYEYHSFSSDSVSFEFFTTAYESDDAFWLVSFTCAVDDYDSNKSDFIKWAKTVSFY